MLSNQETIRELLRAASAWASGLRESGVISRAYTFGSVINDDGRLYHRGSDLDMVVVLPPARLPHDRASHIHAIAAQKPALEIAIRKAIQIETTGAIASLAIVTEIDLQLHVEKNSTRQFFATNVFRNLLDCDAPTAQLSAPVSTECLNRLQYLIDALRKVQARRHARTHFATVDNVVLEKDEPGRIFPKDLCRAAAKLWYHDRHQHDLPKNGEDADLLDGDLFIRGTLERLQCAGMPYDALARTIARRGVPDAPPLSTEDLMLLWEILAAEALERIKGHESYQQMFVSASGAQGEGSAPDAELRAIQAFGAPSLHLGDLDLGAKIFPSIAWDGRRQDFVFADDPEDFRRIDFSMEGAPLPDETLAALVSELKEEIRSESRPERLDTVKEIYRRLTSEGNNEYPRLAGLPYTVNVSPPGTKTVVKVPIGPSRYGIGLIAERQIDTSTAVRLRSQHILNSVAVRVALVFESGGKRHLEFQQRCRDANATYKGAWDVGAAGYVDPVRHLDPEDLQRISPWQAALSELNEELGIEKHWFPHRDNFHFFGVGRNDPTGQIDLLGFCHSHNPVQVNRPLTKKVLAFDRCECDPVSVARFVAEKRNWVPTALLTIILVLKYFGSTKGELEEAFRPCVGVINLAP